uniref:Uncharacterized protein n=2 Tax=Picea TaxID=3328 RepID=A0A101M3M4_PICGL|nr:hypothetical protein ABT39_MTgene238 [Picea glauca]QHR90117.1 hypothetical protein Q903MT_gene4140 [Picea sitchensis]
MPTTPSKQLFSFSNTRLGTFFGSTGTTQPGCLPPTLSLFPMGIFLRNLLMHRIPHLYNRLWREERTSLLLLLGPPHISFLILRDWCHVVCS